MMKTLSSAAMGMLRRLVALNRSIFEVHCSMYKKYENLDTNIKSKNINSSICNVELNGMTGMYVRTTGIQLLWRFHRSGRMGSTNTHCKGL